MIITACALWGIRFLFNHLPYYIDSLIITIINALCATRDINDWQLNATGVQ